MQIKLNLDLAEIEIEEAYYTTLQNLIQNEIEKELRILVRENLRNNREVRNLADQLGNLVIAELVIATKKQEAEDE